MGDFSRAAVPEKGRRAAAAVLVVIAGYHAWNGLVVGELPEFHLAISGLALVLAIVVSLSGAGSAVRSAPARPRTAAQRRLGVWMAIAGTLGSVLWIAFGPWAPKTDFDIIGCYAFSLDDNRLLFVTGQEFYAGARFPSLDFSIVYLLDEGGHAVDMLIEKRGRKAAPARRIPAAVKRRLEVPEHLEVRSGRIDNIEDILVPSSQPER